MSNVEKAITEKHMTLEEANQKYSNLAALVGDKTWHKEKLIENTQRLCDMTDKEIQEHLTKMSDVRKIADALFTDQQKKDALKNGEKDGK